MKPFPSPSTSELLRQKVCWNLDVILCNNSQIYNLNSWQWLRKMKLIPWIKCAKLGEHGCFLSSLHAKFSSLSSTLNVLEKTLYYEVAMNNRNKAFTQCSNYYKRRCLVDWSVISQNYSIYFQIKIIF